ERSRAQPLRISVEQTSPSRVGDRVRDDRERQPRPLGEERRGYAVGKPQRIEHELERQIAAPNARLFLDRRSLRDAFEILLRLPVAYLSYDAVRKRQLRMRAGADAEVIAEAPVVDVVAAREAGLRVRRRLVVLVAGAREHRDGRILDIRRRFVVGQWRRIAVK